MATPITHIVLSEKVFDKYFSEFARKEFFIGTSFPDIRYLGVITRDKTHFEGATLSNIQNEKAFRAGLYFHTLLDNIRENYIIRANAYSLIPDFKHNVQTLKLFEDEILYEKINDWSEISLYLNEILPEELSFPVKKEDIINWHEMLKNYFLQKPNRETRKTFFRKINFSDQDIEEIEKNIDIMRTNLKLEEIIENLNNNFDGLLAG